jgi:hypothetical protein
MASYETKGLEVATTCVTANATHATATAATSASPTRGRWFITGATFATGATPTSAPTMQILTGATVLWTVTLPAAALTQNPLILIFDRPLMGALASTVSATISDLGVGIVGFVNIQAFLGSE